MKNDGGPAFPCELTYTTDGQQGKQTGPSSGIHTGLTLRDYFAAACMQGMCSTAQWPSKQDGGEIGRRAYAIADAMIAERDKE
ncbi:MAG: hypothetical protein Q8P46_11995 [Hyphomicrobiales bacterium]|nr:hypothetical protein [Hyphomicrobiales bacterium]